MNRNVVSLGADSAMTSWAGGRYRITNEAEKIFSVGGKPLAIMIYNSADILGHPWQTIIGAFFDKNKKTNFESVGEFGTAFFKFLDNQKSLFGASEQERWFALTLNVVFSQIVHLARERLRFAGSTDDRSLGRREATLMAINLAHRLFHDEQGNELPNLDCFPGLTTNDIYKKYAGSIDRVIAEHFEDLTDDPDAQAKLREIAGFVVLKDLFLERMMMSGLIFVGFGKDDLYPIFDEFFVSVVFDGTVKRRRNFLNEISNKNHAAISFFADSDASVGFLRGIDNETAGFVFGASEHFMNALGDQFIQGLDFLDENEKQQLAQKMSHEFAPTFQYLLLGALDDKISRERITPFLDVVNNMGPQEMASITGDLVKLNSLRKKIVNEESTVGGPVRVVTISKRGGVTETKIGDGIA
jgi:hypothetical protein